MRSPQNRAADDARTLRQEQQCEDAVATRNAGHNDLHSSRSLIAKLETLVSGSPSPAARLVDSEDLAVDPFALGGGLSGFGLRLR